MKKGNYKLLLFLIFMITILFLNSFISSILNYFNMLFFCLILAFLFKYVFGFEKDRHRYLKDIFLNILIIFLTFIIIYYLLGLIIGFVRTNVIYSLNTMFKIFLPFILITIIKEFLRYQLLIKGSKSKLMIILICLVFIFFDITNNINISFFSTGYEKFIFFSVILLPAISKNISSSYIAMKVGYKPNILWILLFELYSALIPIIPNSGMYVTSMLNFLFPILICYNVYNFFNSKERKVPYGKKKEIEVFSLPVCLVFVLTLVYFTSGLFRYHAITIGSGSMKPNINIGDIVVIDQKYDSKLLKEGTVIAYNYDKKIIVHRIVQVEKVDNEYYYYTQGDANNGVDNYIIYNDMIRGVVKYKIPYIGFPTVWFSQL
ncbi:MAG: signal peptidase I [Bacilli bacterium]|nr:signal peptidase I [Bacilli bacterium]